MDCYKIKGGCDGSRLCDGREWCQICYGQGSYSTPKIIINGVKRSVDLLKEDEEILVRKLFNLSSTESVKKFAQWYTNFYNGDTLEIDDGKITHGPDFDPVVHIIDLSSIPESYFCCDI